MKTKLLAGVMAVVCSAVALAIFVEPVSAGIASRTSINFSPEKSRYARGERMTLVARLTDSCGAAICGKPVTFVKSSSLGCNAIGTGVTDGSGRATLSFTVPTNPNDDYVHIQAVFAGGGGVNASASGQRRIPIGL